MLYLVFLFLFIFSDIKGGTKNRNKDDVVEIKDNKRAFLTKTTSKPLPLGFLLNYEE